MTGPQRTSRTRADKIAAPEPSHPRAHPLIALQRQAGNHAVIALLKADSAEGERGPFRATATRDPKLAIQRSPHPLKEGPDVTRPAGFTEAQFRSWAVDAIDRYEDACTTGLDDFEKSFPEKTSDTDWGLFAATVIGNLIWALACFETGGAAFFISLAGIGVGTAAAAEMAAGQPGGFDKAHFHATTREQVSGKGGIKEQLLALVPKGSDALAAESASKGWDSATAQAELLKRMFDREFITTEAGLPKVDKWAVAKRVEANLFFQAASAMPYSNAEGISEGYEDGVWLEILCEAPGAIEPDGHFTKPVKDWAIHLKHATIWDRSGQLPQMADRLNEVFGHDLNRPMSIMDWPVRKALIIRPLGGGKDDGLHDLSIDLDEKSAIKRWIASGLAQPAYRTYLEVTEDPDYREFERPRGVSEQMVRDIVTTTTLRALRVHEVEEEPHRHRAKLDERFYQYP